MKIICNGKETSVKDGMSIEELILELALNPETVVIECNKKIILRDEYPTRVLVEGDALELIRFVGGG